MMFFSNLEKSSYNQKSVHVHEPQRNIINCLILFQIKIKDKMLAEEYETVKLEVALPILNIAFLDEDKRFLLLLTPKKVIFLADMKLTLNYSYS